MPTINIISNIIMRVNNLNSPSFYYCFLQYILSKHMDFAKMYCNLHPHQLITNFCNKDECLIGLCANCICIHTQSHVQKGTNPEYQNIRDTFKNMQQGLRAQIQLFESDKERIETIKEKVIAKRLKVRQTIDLAKQQVLSVLGSYFEQKQKRMLIQIQSQQKKYGLHCLNRLDSLNSYISRQVSNLISSSQQLTSNNFLQSLTRIRTQNLVNSQKLHHQIVSEILQNQRFNTIISFTKEMTKQLTNVMERAICLQFNGMTFNQKINLSENGLRRPTSQQHRVKTFTNQFANNNTFIPNFKQKNAQSQIRIGQTNSSNGFKTNGQTHQNQKISKVVGIENYNQRLPQQAYVPRISPLESNTNRMLQPQSNPTNSIGNIYMNNPIQIKPELQNVNMHVFPQRNLYSNLNLSSRNQEEAYPRSLQKPYSTNTVQSIYNPMSSINQNSGILGKSSVTGLAKKTKKSGLKMLATTEVDSEIRNQENQRPLASPSAYF